jgi:hypothetical protein
MLVVDVCGHAQTGVITRSSAMKKITGIQNHWCAPAKWRGVQALTGDYEMDGSIAACKNPDMARKIQNHLANGPGYGPLTAYNGYRNYHGDS